MPFYRVTQQGEALAIRLSVKRPDKKFHPSWWVVGQDTENLVAINVMIPTNTIGLFLEYGKIYKGTYPHSHPNVVGVIDCVVLLVDDQRFYIPKQCVRLISEKEIEEELNDEQEQTT